MAENSEYILELLREGVDFTLYRGRERANQMPILAVVVAAEQPSPQSLRRLEHEYSLATELDAAWAAQLLALTRHQGRAVLILKDPGGEPLDRVIVQHKGQPIDLIRFLRIAIGLAAALGQAHRQGLIHKDFKPENAFVDDSGRAWLTDFGIASRLPSERLTLAPPEIIAGTLAYMSPEQAGRMNRSIDSRSDLYSLGVTLYQILTGALRFAVADPLEWVHCHIARQPVAPINRLEVPKPLSDLIMKLLAKNAEERYQTAAGLEADLRRCLSECQSHGRIDPFPLDMNDSSDRLLILEKLYGREREVEALLAAFDRVAAQGTAELVLVSGYSSVGKSSVVNELHKVLVPTRGLFAAGKFDQYKRNIPYATLAHAFQMLVHQILVKSEAEVDHWRHALLDVLGPNGQLIISLIPEIEFVIGKQPPVADLPRQEARNRFQLVFQRFLSAFATAEHPLALFLDDLQWLDAATLELLERLIADPNVRHVLVIGAYRDNEVSSSHPLMRALSVIREAGVKTQEIVLSPLGLDDVGRVIAEAVHCVLNSAGSLAQLVHEKTGGNPFFAIQFLTASVEQGLLRFDQEAPGWVWELGLIRAKNYSSNVVDLMVGKLQRLSGTTQAALQQLACLGNVAEIATLRMVFGQSEEEIHTAHLEAARIGMVFRMEGHYAFSHDRIQEAAYALIPEGQRAPAYLRIGRVLMASMSAGQFAEHQFNVANQLNRGAALLIDPDEKAQVARINLIAGQKATSSAAYASASEHFAAGIALLDEADWTNQYTLTFRLKLERAECEFQTGRFESAEQLIEELLPRAATKVDAAAVYRLKVSLQTVKSEIPQAVASALTCLGLFGIDLPPHPTEEEVEAEYEAVWQTLSGRLIESLIDLPLMADPEMLAAMEVLSVLGPSAYFTDLRLYYLLICRMATISLRHGASKDSAYGYASFGVVLASAFHRYGDAYRFGKLAADPVKKHGFIAIEGKVFDTTGAVAVWTQPIAVAIEFIMAGFRAATEAGDLAYACLGLYLYVPYLLLRNDRLDLVWRESEMALDFTRRAKFGDVADIIVSQQRFIAAMQGRTATFSPSAMRYSTRRRSRRN
jgi:predicted ATPase